MPTCVSIYKMMKYKKMKVFTISSYLRILVSSKTIHFDFENLLHSVEIS